MINNNNKNRSLLSFLGSWLWEHWVAVFLCLVFLFFLFTPYGMIPIVGLPLTTFFFLLRREYKNIFIFWSLFFFLWYVIFTALVFGFEGPLVFDAAKLGNGGCKPGVDCSKTIPALLKYLFGYEESIFGCFLFNSYGLMVVLSAAIGCPVYLPSVFKGFFALISFISKIWGG